LSVAIYPLTPAPAVSDINLSIEAGEFVSFIGPSGCGKSTLLRLIVGLETPSSGSIHVKGCRVNGVPSSVSMVFQHPALLPWLSVRDNVAFGLRMRNLPDAQCRRLADHFITLVGLTEAADKIPRELSGGMQQRVGIARALAVGPEILLLDEPFSALDPETTRELHQRLLDLRQTTDATLIMVSHSIDEALKLSDRIVIFARGRVRTEITVSLTRPRDARSNEFVAQRQELDKLFNHKVC
jgi:ABC-type nitrate/sulfonate/bicarbonate transport system ATPase subunit